MPTTPVAARALVLRTPQQAWLGVLRPTGVSCGFEEDIATGGV